MSKTQTQKYLVVVIPALGYSGVGVGAQAVSYSSAPQNKVHTVTAASAQEAAEKVDIPAGATAHVVPLAHVKTFKRPATARLEAA